MATYHPILDRNTAAAAPGPTDVGNADSALTLGFQFNVTVSCLLKAIRWFQSSTGATNSDSRQAAVWDTDGNVIATATAAAPSGTGWQTLTLPSPVTLSPRTGGKLYVAGVFHPTGGYNADSQWWDSTHPGGGNPVIGPVQLLESPTVSNGLYGYGGALTRPTSMLSNTNYWTDIEVDDLPPASGWSTSLSFG